MNGLTTIPTAPGTAPSLRDQLKVRLAECENYERDTRLLGYTRRMWARRAALIRFELQALAEGGGFANTGNLASPSVTAPEGGAS